MLNQIWRTFLDIVVGQYEADARSFEIIDAFLSGTDKR